MTVLLTFGVSQNWQETEFHETELCQINKIFNFGSSLALVRIGGRQNWQESESTKDMIGGSQNCSKAELAEFRISRSKNQQNEIGKSQNQLKMSLAGVRIIGRQN